MLPTPSAARAVSTIYSVPGQFGKSLKILLAALE